MYLFNASCGVPEFNVIIFALYDKCPGVPSFRFTSPDARSFVGDEVILSCVGTGDVPPRVEWRDEEMLPLEFGLNAAYLKVVVANETQRFQCVLNGVVSSGEIKVEEWVPDCGDVDFDKDLRDYQSASHCHSYTEQVDRGTQPGRQFFSFNMSRSGVAHHLSVTLNSETALLKVIPLLMYNIRISSPGSRYPLYYYNQEDGDGYSTVKKLHETSAEIRLQLVPPVTIRRGITDVGFQVESHIGMDHFTKNHVTMSANMSVCELGDNCYELLGEWDLVEAAFQNSTCSEGLQREYLSYQQCQESLGFGAGPVVSPSARFLIEVPNDLKSSQPFPVHCAIENAISYKWYRIGPDGQREYATSGSALIFPSFEDVGDQGAYVCIGRGGPFANLTVEYQTLILKSGVSTFMANMTLLDETFTDNLSDPSSDAFTALRSETEQKLNRLRWWEFNPPALPRPTIVRFYPGSVVFGFKATMESSSSLPDSEIAASLRESLSLRARDNPGLGLDSERVKVVTLSSCPRDDLEIDKMIVAFPQTRVGMTTEVWEECTLNRNRGSLVVSRMCAGDFTDSARWLEPTVLSKCSGGVNGQLTALKQITVTSNNVGEVARSVSSLTGDASLIDKETVPLVADVLDSIVNARDPSPKVTSNVVGIVNNLLQVEGDVLNETRDKNSTSRIVLALEGQVSHILADGGNFSEVQHSLAVEALNVPPGSLAEGVGFVAFEGETTDEALTEDRIRVYYSVSGIPAGRVESSIELPSEVFEKLPTAAGSPVPVSFILYQNSRLFPSRLIAEAEVSGSPLAVGSSVISATVEADFPIENLPGEAPVVTTFLQNQVGRERMRSERGVDCVFWDFNLRDSVGDWSTEGCRQATSVSGRTVCHCDHATSFAVLVDIHGHSSPALDIISKIGCGVSIGALFLTIVIYLAIKSVREKTAARILVSLSLSLLCLYLVFLVGIEQTSSRVGCVIVAVLMHYFTLTSIAWMGVEATNLYLKLVRVYNANVGHFMVKASVAAWGLPMVVVGSILAVDYTFYDNKIRCFLNPGTALYFGQLLMIGLVLLYNAVIFVLITRRLTCKADKIQHSTLTKKRDKTVKRLQNMVAISVLLGLTWAFGLLSVLESSSFAFQVLFCVFNSLQGLFIFLLFVLRQDKIRDKLLGSWSHKKEASRDTSTTPYSRSPRATDVDGPPSKRGKGNEYLTMDDMAKCK